MRVLNIDLNYMMDPSLDLYDNFYYSDNPTIRWSELYDNSEFEESHFRVDIGSIMYCYHLFLKVIKESKNVTFAYDNDAILYRIKDYSNIDLISIDQKDDILSGDFFSSPNIKGLDMEIDSIKSNRVSEDNWVGWIHYKEKLNSYTWIRNINSNQTENKKIKSDYGFKQLGDKAVSKFRTEYVFDDYKFDNVFVSLSPQYVPKTHWHYFTMFMMAYEEQTGKSIDIITKQRHQYDVVYENITNKLTDTPLLEVE